VRVELRAKAEPDAELIGLAVAALVLPALAIWLIGFGGSLPRNGLHDLLAFPCTFCGGTRSLVHLFSGDLAAAFAMNPLVASGTLAVLGWCVYAAGALLFSQSRIRLVLESLLELRLVAAGALLLLIANWVYVWTMGI
jgi:hypothetical protein